MYHEVGKFYSYFIDDYNEIKYALESAGYTLCAQPDGDCSIMKYGEMPDDDIDDWEGGYPDDI